MQEKKNLIITSGDPGGIGIQIIIKALYSFVVPDAWRIVILGDLPAYSTVCREMKLDQCWDIVLPSEKFIHGFQPQNNKIILVDFHNISQLKPGTTGRDYGRAAMQYLDYAMDLFNKGFMHALVTAPICKKSLWEAGYCYAGHTHYLAEKAGLKYLTMSMLSTSLKIFFVTDHIPFMRIKKMLTRSRITTTIERGWKCLSSLRYNNIRFGICSLNPHAGEDGIFGKEETSLNDTCLLMRNKGLNLSVPMAPEICFKKAVAGEFNGVIALYHDQGMIPFKLVSGGKGINVSLGLPFTRVSPEHGTAFDISAQFIADSTSMLNALYFAIGNWRS